MEIYIFFSLLIISCGFFLYETYKRYRYVKLGRPENRFDRPFERWRYFFTHALGQGKILNYPLFGIFHGFIMWGFLVLLLSIPNMVAEGLFHTRIPYVGDNPVYLFIKDIFIALVMIGVIGSLLRRTVKKPEWLKNTPVAFVILLLILVIVTTEVLFHGSQFAMGEGVDFIGAAPLAAASSRLFVNLNMDTLLTAKTLFWWAHFLAIFSFLFIVPRSKHLHLVFAPFNTYWHSLTPKGALSKIQIDELNGKAYGVNRLEDFTWKQLFDVYACVKCGRCNECCPANQSGEPLKPKRINGRLRKHIEQRAPLIIKSKALRSNKADSKAETENAVPIKGTKAKKSFRKKNIIGDVLEKEFIWSCSTCGGCVEACPVSIEHTSKLIDMRRYMVSTEGNASEEMKQFFAKIENYGNPWGMNRNAGYDRVKDLGLPTLSENPEAQYVYFIGCAGLFDEKARKAAIAFVKIIKSAGVNFAVLGHDEWCCGETARRMGNEYLFQKIVQRNVSRWNYLGVKKIITACSHCFNTLKNEYSQFGGEYEVTHHSVFLANLLKRGELKPSKNIDKTITYHDSCYLGRYNDFYNEPREILKVIPGVRLTDIPRSRKKSFCCGAGGGRIWMKAKSENLISNNRAMEALSTEAEVISTACPYCLITLSEEIKMNGDKCNIKTMDIAEILEMSL